MPDIIFIFAEKNGFQLDYVELNKTNQHRIYRSGYSTFEVEQALKAYRRLWIKENLGEWFKL
jgi:hypothetical protein